MALRRTFGILSGVFLLFYTVPCVVWYVLVKAFVTQEYSLKLDTQYSCFIIFMLLAQVAAVLLIANKPRAAAVLMSAVAVIYALYALPGLLSIAAGSYDELITVSGIPGFYAAAPGLEIAAYILFAAALWLRGGRSLVLGAASSIFTVNAVILRFDMAQYEIGNPTMFNLLPAGFALAALFAGLYRFFDRKAEKTPDADLVPADERDY